MTRKELQNALKDQTIDKIRALGWDYVNTVRPPKVFWNPERDLIHWGCLCLGLKNFKIVGSPRMEHKHFMLGDISWGIFYHAYENSQRI